MIQRTALLAGLFVAALAGPARAEYTAMIQLLPGLMCENPDALARLTLPDGSSKTARPNPTASDLAAKAAGKCIDLSDNVDVTLITRRKNTSIVTVDPRDGKGSRTFYVPNVDFSLQTQNLAALRAASPAGAIPERCYNDGDRPVTFTAIIGSGTFTPEGQQPYRYRFLRFPAPVCVEQSGWGMIAILASFDSFNPAADASSIPDGVTVTVTGMIGTVNTGNQPLTLQFLADSVTRH